MIEVNAHSLRNANRLDRAIQRGIKIVIILVPIWVPILALMLVGDMALMLLGTKTFLW